MASASPNTVRFNGSPPVARVTCPWCGVLTSGPATSVHSAHELSDKRYEWAVVYKCADPACWRPSLLVHESKSKMLYANQDYPVSIYPPRRSDYAPEGVPDKLARDFREAQDSRAAGFIYGAAVVGRRVLQAAVRSFVGELKDLRTEIDALTSDQLPAYLKKAAHQVRLTGNDAAHADEVTPEEASDLLEFTERVLDQLYVAPAQVKAAESRRARKP